MSSKPKILLLILITLLPSLSKAARVPEYGAIQRIALDLLEYCPPKECTMIFSGRSGTAVAAYLDALLGGQTLQVPLSKFRANPWKNQGEQNAALSQDEEKKLFAHFDRFIDRSRLTGRRIITVDYALSGASQFAFTAYLNRWLTAETIEGAATPVVLADAENTFDIEENARRYHVEISKTLRLRGRTRLVFGGEEFDAFSAYGSYEFLKNAEPPRREARPQYRALVSEISDRQNRDPAVRKFKTSGIRSEEMPGFVAQIRKLWVRICGETLLPDF